MQPIGIGTSPSRVARRTATRGRFVAGIAATRAEVEAALRLRNEIFNVEMSGCTSDDGLESDDFDAVCDHLIVRDETDGRVVGTYRLNSLSPGKTVRDFYSYTEFGIENLPAEILENAVEIGRACIAREHRGTSVLFQLWKGLATYLRERDKRYFFGCCSIFTTDFAAATATYEKLRDDRHVHESFYVEPRLGAAESVHGASPAELPPLMELYLRIGAKVCGPPTIDRAFGTIDFFVVFDIETIDAKYRRMFFS